MNVQWNACEAGGPTDTVIVQNLIGNKTAATEKKTSTDRDDTDEAVGHGKKFRLRIVQLLNMQLLMHIKPYP